jgi:AcrR family transcriptional regulator
LADDVTSVNICVVNDAAEPHTDVTTARAAGRPYHHGSLRAALVESGVTLARAGGPAAVVLREASRRAGVSHTAAYRHFASHEALLDEVAGAAAAALARAMEDRIADASSSPERLRAVGLAYIDFALEEPGLFRTAFGTHPAAGWPEGTGRGRTGRSPYELLAGVLDELEAAGMLRPGVREGAEIAAWSAVHGFACLVLDGPLRAMGEAERDAARDLVLERIDSALLLPWRIRAGPPPPDACPASLTGSC